MSVGEDTLAQLREAIEQAARADAPALVAEARIEARAKVREILAEALSERLLSLAEQELDCENGTAAARGPAQRPAPPERRARPAAPSSLRADDLQSRRPERAALDGSAQPRGPSLLGEAGRADPSAPSALGWYVYGVVRADAELSPLDGIDGEHEVSLIRGESIAAVVSEVALEEFGEQALKQHLEDLSWLETHARRHEHILDRAREQTTLVPMRLCTIYRDERSVREMLAREHEFLADALDRLQGCTEWGVKVFMLGSPSGEGEPEQHAAEQGLGPGTGYLMQQQLRQQRHRDAEAAIDLRCEQLHGALAQASAEAKVNLVQPAELTSRSEPMVFNGVYLVRDSAADEFARTFAGQQEELERDGFEAEMTGPWPPYNFVNSPEEMGR